MHEAVALCLLGVVLAVAVVRPRQVPEAIVAVPAALVVIAVGAIGWGAARAELHRLWPVVGFLAAVLVLADGCAREGVFDAAASRLARRRAGWRGGSRLLVGLAALAAGTTAILSLDTTVVLLTPVVLATTGRLRVPPRAHLYLTAHLANSASLLLPVSNLTNLLAIAVLPLSFARFGALMALPWLVAVAAEVLMVRRWFRTDLAVSPGAAGAEPQPWPWFSVVVLLLTLGGFLACSFAGVSPAWAAVSGAAVLAGKRLLQRKTSARQVVASAAPLFCLFVLALGVVVRAVSDDGVADVVRHLVPGSSSWLSLVAVAAVGALLANLLNNLPATLLLLPVVAAAGPAQVLAMLIGVNVGPNLTYPGSLATLLWRRAVERVPDVPTLRDFTRLGLLTVPVTLVASTTALWLSLRLVGLGP